MVVRKLVTVHVALNVKMDVAKRVPVAEDVLHLAMEIVVQIVRTLALQVEWIAITLVQIHVKLGVTPHVMKQIVKMGVLVGVLSSVLQIVRMAAMVIAVMDVTIGAMEAAN